MRFVPLAVEGAFLIEGEPLTDERGSFTRIFDEAEFERHRLATRYRQWSVSENARRGTLRGLHYQAEPHSEAKLVQCLRGAAFDVLLDVRRSSASRGKVATAWLSASTLAAVYLPEGVAHGFLTLQDGTALCYHITKGHEPEAARGVRWNDPAFSIPWPEPVRVISPRDAAYPDHEP